MNFSTRRSPSLSLGLYVTAWQTSNDDPSALYSRRHVINNRGRILPVPTQLNWTRPSTRQEITDAGCVSNTSKCASILYSDQNIELISAPHRLASILIQFLESQSTFYFGWKKCLPTVRVDDASQSRRRPT